MANLGVACPAPNLWHESGPDVPATWTPETRPPDCQARLQSIWFEGRLLLSAGIAGHLHTVHGLDLQQAWHLANEAAR